jgi:carbon starvation protein
MGKTAKILFGTFALLALILVVAVFAAVAGKTLESTPQVVIPTFGLIVVALVVGVLMYRVQLNVLLCSAIGIALLFGLIVAGYYLPIQLPVENPEKLWTVILLIYGMIARPQMRAPAYISFVTSKGWMWPMLFVTVACGALSGFHSLVSSGTTSKQVKRMSDARPIGYGAMILESALAVLAIVAVTAGLYWTSAPDGNKALVFQDVFEDGGWIKAFGTGYGQLTKVFFGALGSLIGITMLKTFIMTTLDSATRITRYLCNELLGETLGITPLKNKYVAVALVGISSGALALGNWKAIWPVFGAANQLVASLVLIVASVYLLMRKRNFAFTAVPAGIMLVTTIAALIYQAYGFATAEGEKRNMLLAVVSVVLIFLAVFLAYTALVAVARVRKNGARQEAMSN